ncbi:MAG: hypothetical protein JO082_05820 [Mycobacterium sp.]|nr:hypothetical protein [Mycobacterium sp.]MBV9721417.1 hypothetical protein [Mycobacterium sp.]
MPDASARRRRIGVRALGCTATILMAIVGCTTVTEGMPTVDTAIAPAYRTSVSLSISESAATSSIRETQHQRSLTTRAILTACESFISSSKDAVNKVNDFVEAYNAGGDTTSAEGPAIDALNHSADVVAGSISGPLSQDLREQLTAYSDAARQVADAIRMHAATGDFNQRVNQLNDTKTKAVKLCLAS